MPGTRHSFARLNPGCCAIGADPAAAPPAAAAADDEDDDKDSMPTVSRAGRVVVGVGVRAGGELTTAAYVPVIGKGF